MPLTNKDAIYLRDLASRIRQFVVAVEESLNSVGATEIPRMLESGDVRPSDIEKLEELANAINK
jgi:hypothetical protein